ncbi:MAG: hypothetical protein Q8L45_01110 [Xanthomonadaceae bacterium]|nr:hypothetical protein [Xanthomonadaceae bacterium]MDP2185987.1 hypothetical protein [Xanthomonadales bacterium]MDZ4377975.1 hypothetical protein [Xanthomonadaceae bacterium]
MNNTLPSQNMSIFTTLLGKRITSVKRQLFKHDMDLPGYEQNADGPIQFIINDGSIVHFIADTETFSIGIVSGEMPRFGSSYELRDVSNNSFWSGKVGQEIKQIALLKSKDWSKDYPCEFGIELSFSYGETALIEYLDEEDYPDMIKVADHYTGQPCIVQLVDSCR